MTKKEQDRLKKYKIAAQDLDFEQGKAGLLGTGAFASVRKASYFGQSVAVKVPKGTMSIGGAMETFEDDGEMDELVEK